MHYFPDTAEVFSFLMQILYAADQPYIPLPCFSKKRRYGMVLSVSGHTITFNPEDNFNYISGGTTCLEATCGRVESRGAAEGWRRAVLQAASTGCCSMHTCIILLRHAGKNTGAKNPNLPESRLPWICYQLNSLNCCGVIIMLL